MKISFICKINSKEDNSFYKVEVDEKDMRLVPNIGITIERKIKCEKDLIINGYYIVWDGKVSEDQLYVEITNVTYLALYTDYLQSKEYN